MNTNLKRHIEKLAHYCCHQINVYKKIRSTCSRITRGVFVLLQVFGPKFAFSLQRQLLHDGLLGDGVSPVRLGVRFPVLKVGTGRLGVACMI